jgi:hypothetical protein
MPFDEVHEACVSEIAEQLTKGHQRRLGQVMAT